MGKLYGTGEVCELCNVSRKQLRYYEEHGLITNVRRNPENNYRYYDEYNLCQILIVKELKRIGFTIEEIRLMNMDTVGGIREAVKKRVFNAKEDLNRALHRYELSSEKYLSLMYAVSLLNANGYDTGAEPPARYEIINFPGQDVISMTFRDNFYAVGEHTEYMARMEKIIEEYGITTLGSTINIYYDHFDSAACVFDRQSHDIEVCMTVADMKKPCPYFKRLESCRVLATTHFGSFEKDLSKTYLDLLHYARDMGYRLANTTIEEWLIGTLNTSNQNNWVTRIMIPFADQ